MKYYNRLFKKMLLFFSFFFSTTFLIISWAQNAPSSSKLGISLEESPSNIPAAPLEYCPKNKKCVVIKDSDVASMEVITRPNNILNTGKDLSFFNPIIEDRGTYYKNSDTWTNEMRLLENGEEYKNYDEKMDALPISSESSTVTFKRNINQILRSNVSFEFEVKHDKKFYRMEAGLFIHNELLKKSLLRKIGYSVPPIKYIKNINLYFENLHEAESFIKKLGDKLGRDPRRWIRNIKKIDDENVCRWFILDKSGNPVSRDDFKKPVTLKLQDFILMERNDFPYNVAFGYLSSDDKIKRRRHLRSLLLVHNLLHIPDSVNKFLSIPGRVEDGYITLPIRRFQSEFRPSFSDLKWILRRISKLKRADFEDVVAQGFYPEPVEKILVEKIIARRNFLHEKILSKECDGNSAKYCINNKGELKPNLELSGFSGLLNEGKLTKVTVEDANDNALSCKDEISSNDNPYNDPDRWWVGYANRFSQAEIETLLTWDNIKPYLKSILTSNVLSLITRKIQMKLSTDKGELEKKHFKELGKKQIDYFLDNGEILEIPVEIWSEDLYGVRPILSRDLIFGSYQGSGHNIQMVDNFGLEISLGSYLGVHGLELGKEFAAGSAEIFHSWKYTHVRPIECDLKAVKNKKQEQIDKEKEDQKGKRQESEGVITSESQLDKKTTSENASCIEKARDYEFENLIVPYLMSGLFDKLDYIENCMGKDNLKKPQGLNTKRGSGFHCNETKDPFYDGDGFNYFTDEEIGEKSVKDLLKEMKRKEEDMLFSGEEFLKFANQFVFKIADPKYLKKYNIDIGDSKALRMLPTLKDMEYSIEDQILSILKLKNSKKMKKAIKKVLKKNKYLQNALPEEEVQALKTRTYKLKDLLRLSNSMIQYYSLRLKNNEPITLSQNMLRDELLSVRHSSTSLVSEMTNDDSDQPERNPEDQASEKRYFAEFYFDVLDKFIGVNESFIVTSTSGAKLGMSYQQFPTSEVIPQIGFQLGGQSFDRIHVYRKSKNIFQVYTTDTSYASYEVKGSLKKWIPLLTIKKGGIEKGRATTRLYEYEIDPQFEMTADKITSEDGTTKYNFYENVDDKFFHNVTQLRKALESDHYFNPAMNYDQSFDEDLKANNQLTTNENEEASAKNEQTYEQCKKKYDHFSNSNNQSSLAKKFEYEYPVIVNHNYYQDYWGINLLFYEWFSLDTFDSMEVSIPRRVKRPCYPNGQTVRLYRNSLGHRFGTNYQDVVADVINYGVNEASPNSDFIFSIPGNGVAGKSIGGHDYSKNVIIDAEVDESKNEFIDLHATVHHRWRGWSADNEKENKSDEDEIYHSELIELIKSEVNPVFFDSREYYSSVDRKDESKLQKENTPFFEVRHFDQTGKLRLYTINSNLYISEKGLNNLVNTSVDRFKELYVKHSPIELANRFGPEGGKILFKPRSAGEEKRQERIIEKAMYYSDKEYVRVQNESIARKIINQNQSRLDFFKGWTQYYHKSSSVKDKTEALKILVNFCSAVLNFEGFTKLISAPNMHEPELYYVEGNVLGFYEGDEVMNSTNFLLSKKSNTRGFKFKDNDKMTGQVDHYMNETHFSEGEFFLYWLLRKL